MARAIGGEKYQSENFLKAFHCAISTQYRVY